MKYWGPDDICGRDLDAGQTMSAKGWPATTGAKLNTNGTIKGFYEMEIIPNTLRQGYFYNINTFEDEYGLVVDVEYRTRLADDPTWVETTDTMSMDTFGVDPNLIGWQRTPSNVNDAYDRAMKGV